MFLGCIGALQSVARLVAAYSTGHLDFDPSFIIFFVLGSSIMNGSNVARKWAAGISILLTSISLLCIVTGDGAISFFGGLDYFAPSPTYYLFFMFVILSSLPALILLHPKVKLQFQN